MKPTSCVRLLNWFGASPTLYASAVYSREERESSTAPAAARAVHQERQRQLTLLQVASPVSAARCQLTPGQKPDVQLPGACDSFQVASAFGAADFGSSTRSGYCVRTECREFVRAACLATYATASSTDTAAVAVAVAAIRAILSIIADSASAARGARADLALLFSGEGTIAAVRPDKHHAMDNNDTIWYITRFCIRVIFSYGRPFQGAEIPPSRRSLRLGPASRVGGQLAIALQRSRGGRIMPQNVHSSRGNTAGDSRIFQGGICRFCWGRARRRPGVVRFSSILCARVIVSVHPGLFSGRPHLGQT